MGRPKKQDGEKLTKVISLRFSEREYSALKKWASNVGCSRVCVPVRALILDVLKEKKMSLLKRFFRSQVLFERGTR